MGSAQVGATALLAERNSAMNIQSAKDDMYDLWVIL